MSMDMAEIRETSDVNEVNKLLSEKWELLEVVKKRNDESEFVVYILGLPRIEKRKKEQPNYDHLSL